MKEQLVAKLHADGSGDVDHPVSGSERESCVSAMTKMMKSCGQNAGNPSTGHSAKSLSLSA